MLRSSISKNNDSATENTSRQLAGSLSAGDDVQLSEGHDQATHTIIQVTDAGTAELEDGRFAALSKLRRVASDEQWRPVKDFEHKYRISSHGKIVSLNYAHTSQERMLQVKRKVTPMVTLSNGAVKAQLYVSRLVAQHFMDKPAGNLNYLIHKDQDSHNCRVDNLEWRSHESAFGGCTGSKHYKAKLSDEQVASVRLRASLGETHQALATEFGVSRPSISRLVALIDRK